MKNNKKMIAIVAAIVIALIGLIAYILHDSGDSNSPKTTATGQLVNFQGAELQEEKDGKLVWALSAEKIEYDPRSKSIVLTNLKGLFYQDDVTTTITAPHAVLSGDHNSLDVDGGVTASNTEGASFKLMHYILIIRQSYLLQKLLLHMTQKILHWLVIS